MNRLSVGVIGFGRFGALLPKLFGDFCDIKVYSGSQVKDNRLFFPLEDVLGCDLIIPAVPISVLEPWLLKHQALIQAHGFNGQIWVSVCSVMTKPKQWLKRNLPSGIKFLVSHPMFGPVSSKNGTIFTNLPWIIEGSWNHLPSNALTLFEHCKHAGIRLNFMSANSHDKLMARSQAVAFLFGEIGNRLQFTSGQLDTVGFAHLMANQQIYAKDSHQLLQDMFEFNPYAKEMAQEVQRAVNEFVLNLK